MVACSSPTKQDIVGLWVEDRATSDSGRPAICGSFEFYANGRFKAQNIPSEHFFIKPSGRIDASGSLKLDVSSNDPFAIHRVELISDPVEGFPLGFGSELGVTTDERALFIGTNTHIVFHKRDSAKCE